MSSSPEKQKRRPRQEHEKKKTQKKKSTRGQSETHYGECKKNTTFSLTPKAIALLKQGSEDLGISRSEVIEKLVRGEIKLTVDVRDSA